VFILVKRALKINYKVYGSAVVTRASVDAAAALDTRIADPDATTSLSAIGLPRAFFLQLVPS
jgi:hypothetical protein